MKVQNVMKLLRGVRKKRPILECINYNSDTQLMSITNSYALVQEQCKVQLDYTFNLNVFDLKLSQGKYPEVESIKKVSYNIESIESIDIILVDNKMYYKINNNYSVLFDKDLVDNSFKCLDNIVNGKNKYVSLNDINTEYLVIDNNIKLVYHDYKTNDFVLVLGVRK